MPNIQSQKKRAITNIKKAQRNTAEKSALKSTMKAALKAIGTSDKEAAIAAVNKLNSRLDKAVSSGIHHKNYANRQKARFAKAINNVQ